MGFQYCDFCTVEGINGAGREMILSLLRILIAVLNAGRGCVWVEFRGRCFVEWQAREKRIKSTTTVAQEDY